jgi:hypothetical protein
MSDVPVVADGLHLAGFEGKPELLGEALENTES